MKEMSMRDYVDSIMKEPLSIPIFQIDQQIDIDQMISSVNLINDFIEEQKREMKIVQSFLENSKKVLKDMKDIDIEDLSSGEIEKLKKIIDLINEYSSKINT